MIRTLRALLGAVVSLAPLSAQSDPPAPRAESTHRAPSGPITLFDGSTLTGWVTAGGRYDGEAEWTIEDGAITGRVGAGGKGGLIYTERYWHSFELELETRIDYPFDSGIFVRMSPHGKGAQVTLDYRPDGEVGAIYSDGWLEHNTTAKASFRRDAWNHFRVRCTGRDFRLEVWMNGEPIMDYRLPKGSEGYAESGRIGLQVHGGREEPGKAQFRAITLRELPVFDRDEFRLEDGDRLVPTGAGWEPLIDAELSKWSAAGDGEGFLVDGDVLALLCKGGSPELRTTEDFEDFVLRMDFNIARMCNSGIFVRAARDGSNPAYSGAEIQILDDFHWEAVTKSKLAPWQFSGGLYGAVAPRVTDALYPIGRWNSYEIRCEGSRIRCELNGRTLYDVDTDTLHVEQGKPFAERARRGFLGIQRHAPAEVTGDAYAWFRNVWVHRIGR